MGEQEDRLVSVHDVLGFLPDIDSLSDPCVVRSDSWEEATIISNYLFCSLAILHPRVGHTTNVLSPFISVLSHSDCYSTIPAV